MNTEPEQTPYQSTDANVAPPLDETPVDSSFPRSKAMQQSPQLSSAALTRLLIGMCLLPVITIFALFLYMPPAAEGELDCQFSAIGLPDEGFYAIEYRLREEYDGGELVVTNREAFDWTHLNMVVNGHYQVYDKEPIAAGTSKHYKLERFVSRAGARFSLRYNQLKSARIYARRDNPKHDRATYSCTFVDGKATVADQ